MGRLSIASACVNDSKCYDGDTVRCVGGEWEGRGDGRGEVSVKRPFCVLYYLCRQTE